MLIVLMNQAYVGFASDMNAVVVAFRGTQENRYFFYISALLVDTYRVCF
jgi:hypothetical protein